MVEGWLMPAIRSTFERSLPDDCPTSKLVFDCLMKLSLCVLLGLIIVMSCKSPPPAYQDDYATLIRVNQMGYYPKGVKKFVLADSVGASKFQLVDQESMEVVFEGSLSGQQFWDLSNENVQGGDFTTFEKTGKYAIYIEPYGYSYAFDIKENLYDDALKASARSYYYQRVSTDLTKEYAGEYVRENGHTDVSIPFHASTGKEGVLDAPGGWYDAGDYGKYVVNGSYALGELLVLYEAYPEKLGDGSLNIPESGNGIPDYLDELKYEMDWLLKMQDNDGGVFFKLTAEGFEGMVLPNETSKQRYIFRKSTTATLDFSAVAAKFGRAMQPFDTEYANLCIGASKEAWSWALKNPDIPFTNPSGVITGQYGDDDFSQEFYWAAAELWISTGDEAYLKFLRENPVGFEFYPGDSWANQMHYIGAYALMDQEMDSELADQVRAQIITEADRLVSLASKNDYFQPIEDFQWGSNSDVLNTCMIISHAYRHTRDKKYLDAIQEITDYIFGKNATGYCFLTGYGDLYPVNVHHRLSEGDAIPGPIPGFLSGGPNYHKQDANDVAYPEVTYPMTSWVDQLPSYASNEICLNWNAPLTYVLGFLEEESN